MSSPPRFATSRCLLLALVLAALLAPTVSAAPIRFGTEGGFGYPNGGSSGTISGTRYLISGYIQSTFNNAYDNRRMGLGFNRLTVPDPVTTDPAFPYGRPQSATLTDVPFWFRFDFDQRDYDFQTDLVIEGVLNGQITGYDPDGKLLTATTTWIHSSQPDAVPAPFRDLIGHPERLQIKADIGDLRLGFEATIVPEPASFLVFLAVLSGLAVRHRRRSSADC